MPVQTQILTRRGTAASWTSTNPTLGAGEIGYETDTGRFKIGTGAAAWASLGYFNRDPLTTKGDLYTFSTTDDRLAVGANGETIVADSSTSTGLRYGANYAAGKNKIINGDMSIWQRGTSFTNPAAGSYSADRWFFNYAGTFTGSISQQAFTPGTAPAAPYESSFFLRINRTNSTSIAPTFYQKVEDVRTLANQTITFSFWAKADSARSVGVNYFQNFGSGGSAGVTGSVGTASLTTSFQRFTFTFAMPSISGKTIGTSNFMAVYFDLPDSVTFTLDFWGFQMEAGSVATAFQTATGTIQGELAACQRYYYRAEGANNEALNTANFASTTLANIVITMPVQMRTDPSFNKGANDIIVIYVTSNWTSTNITLDSVSFRSASINVTVSGATLGQAGIAYLRNMANNYLEFSAEL